MSLSKQNFSWNRIFHTFIRNILGAFWKLPYRRPNDLFITINFVSYTSILGLLHLQLTVWKFKNFSVTEKFPWNQFCKGIKINFTKKSESQKNSATFTLCNYLYHLLPVTVFSSFFTIFPKNLISRNFFCSFSVKEERHFIWRYGRSC